ncbi:MAG TPA: glycosyl hydrolase [Terriglobia bacterium]|nr:glycosyl hydrolase [Terriglobia bacterium]
MRGIKKALRVLLPALAALSLMAQSPARPAGDLLKENFLHPPRQYSITPFWSWNDTLVRGKIIWQMDQLVDKGVYGAFMHARPGIDQSRTPYFSKGWWDAVGVAVRHAHKVGFHTWIYDEDGWPSGSAGGRTIRANPKRNLGTGLEAKAVPVQGPRLVKVNFPKARFVIAARVTAHGALDPKSFVNLTALNRQPGGGTWQAPAGEWRLTIFSPVPMNYPFVDYINPATVRDFIDITYEAYYKRFPQYFGNTIPGSFFDEISNIPLAWNPVLRERFRKEKGYDIADRLPMLFYDAGPKTIKVRCDYFDVFSHLFADSWFKQIADWDAAHHIEMTGHTLEPLWNYTDEGDYFRTWRNVQIPGTDNEDFRYTFPRVIGSWKPKQISSVSHMYGKKRTTAETMGGAGWAITLDQTRYGINMLSVYGVNFFVFHKFDYNESSNPTRMDDWPNSWFYQNPYWKYFKKLAVYTNRIAYLNVQGKHVADVAVMYPIEDAWSLGLSMGREPKPNRVDVPGLATTGMEDQPVVAQVVDRLETEQVDCDVADTDSIISSSWAGDGRAKIGTEKYRVLILPGARTVSLAAYRRIEKLAEDGMRVIAVGAVPENSAEHGADDPEVIGISRRLFGPGGAGILVRSGSAMMAAVRAAARDDVTVKGMRARELRYLHRHVGTKEIYWMVNSERVPQHWQVRFDATGRAEKWDPQDGSVTPLAVEKETAGHTTLNLKFNPWAAYYVVFDSTKPPLAAPTEPSANPSLPAVQVKGPWTLQLAPTQLDYRWTANPGETTVSLPVMDVRIARQGEKDGDPASPNWRQVKLVDSLNPLKGAARYLTPWDAPWITRYTYAEFPGKLGGPELVFRKEVDLGFKPSDARLTLTADQSFVCNVNGVKVGEARGVKRPVTLRQLPLHEGKNTIEIKVQGNGYLLAEGIVRGAAGGQLLLRTGKDWQVKSPEDQEWMAAYPFAYPPFGKWGDIPLGRKTQALPAVVWYQGVVPVGARSVEAPKIEGEYEVFLNHRPLKVSDQAPTPLPSNLPANSVISLRVKVERAEQGLEAPLVFHCEPAKAGLGDWQKLGLKWYTGRGIYKTSFELPATYSGHRLELDLGDLRYTGEVWINNQRVGDMVWPPYRCDVSRYVHAGRNTLTVVVANLLANKMRWDIFDSAISNTISRWWHDANIIRESDHLKSGLFGPVRIVDKGSAQGQTRQAMY